MSRSAFLIFTAVVAIIYGLGLVLVPAMVNEMHGLASSPATSVMSRYFGVALLGIAVMAWLAREAADSDALSAFLQGACVMNVIGLIVSLHAVFTGLMNAVGWLPVIIQLLLAIGFGYFGFLRR